MDVQTILISVAGIVATGSLSRAGANITDNVLLKSKQLLTLIKDRLPRIATVLQNNEQPVDYDRVCTEIKAIAQSDPEMQKLLQEMAQAVSEDSEVTHRVKYELNKPSANSSTVIEKWNGINVKGGYLLITGNTLNF